ncbi:MAG: hypothetical protein K0B09_12365 [Bacteroidales bacterium]|nr:hypothetical protein [Bacteroidales bacterium]
MDALIIKADKKSQKLLLELARRLGASVLSISEDQYEDFALGQAMDQAKTGELVSRETIMEKLNKK